MNGSELYVQRRANDLRKEEAPLNSEADRVNKLQSMITKAIRGVTDRRQQYILLVDSLSRVTYVTGNRHARFLGGKGAAKSPTYPTSNVLSTDSIYFLFRTDEE